MAEGLVSQLEDMNGGDQDGDNYFDDVEMAVTGIDMLLNNGFDEAFALFDKYKNESPLMHSGYSFVFFMVIVWNFVVSDICTSMISAFRKAARVKNCNRVGTRNRV